MKFTRLLKLFLAYSFAFFLFLGPSLPVHGLDMESFTFINRVVAIEEPGAPILFEDGIVFTAGAGAQRVGIAFQHESYKNIHWFKRLYKPYTRGKEDYDKKNPLLDEGKSFDSGILFLALTWPEELDTLSYRMIIDGNWVRDPWNPEYYEDFKTGLFISQVSLSSLLCTADSSAICRPPRERDKGPIICDGTVTFICEEEKAGEDIYLAGTFNAWDPFMYRLKEAGGYYAITLALPAGDYHYLFYKDGQPLLDEANPLKVYDKSGQARSLLRIK